MIQDNTEPIEGHDSRLDTPNKAEDSLGIICELGNLPPGAIVSEEGLARIFRRHHVSIKRAVQRGELPPSVRLFGELVWTVAVIQEHLKNRLETARKENEQMTKKFMKLNP